MRIPKYTTTTTTTTTNSHIFTSKSRSMDLSNLSFSPPHQPQNGKTLDQLSLEEEEEEEGERFGVILSRNCSSSASQRFRENTTSSNNNNNSIGNEGIKKSNGSTKFEGIVRRAFSMRKSSSVGDGYWRIHDDVDVDGDVIQEEEEVGEEEKKKKRGKFFRACKSLFKF